MRRALLTLVLGAAQLVASETVCARPPDQVKHSPVPPLKEQRNSGVNTATRSSSGSARRSNKTLGIPLAHQATSRRSTGRPLPLPNDSGRSTSVAANTESETTPADDAQQPELWESEEMKFAREAVLEFCRRSAQTTVEEGQQFLAELSQLSSEEMQSWLERFYARRHRFLRESEARQLSRQFMVERSYGRHEERRNTAARIAEIRGGVVATRATQPIEVYTGAGFSSHLSLYYGGFSYDPFIPVFDPASPRGDRARAAAAASLPGDLPRDDPRNFLTGDEGFISGDEPFINGVAPPPVLTSPVLAPPPIVAAPASVEIAPGFVGPVRGE